MADTAPMGKDEAIDLLRDALEHYQRLAPDTITAREALRMTEHLAPSTAPEGTVTDYGTPVDERAAFEKAINAQRFFPRELDFSRGRSPGGRDEYVNSHIESNWNGWKLRAALASRPAEVDDEGLPALPPASGRIYVQNGYTRASTRPGKGLPLFTAAQFRQGQRDAVAAYRAAKEFCDENCLSYRREPACPMGKLCVSESR